MQNKKRLNRTCLNIFQHVDWNYFFYTKNDLIKQTIFFKYFLEKYLQKKLNLKLIKILKIYKFNNTYYYTLLIDNIQNSFFFSELIKNKPWYKNTFLNNNLKKRNLKITQTTIKHKFLKKNKIKLKWFYFLYFFIKIVMFNYYEYKKKFIHIKKKTLIFIIKIFNLFKYFKYFLYKYRPYYLCFLNKKISKNYNIKLLYTKFNIYKIFFKNIFKINSKLFKFTLKFNVWNFNFLLCKLYFFFFQQYLNTYSKWTNWKYIQSKNLIKCLFFYLKKKTLKKKIKQNSKVYYLNNIHNKENKHLQFFFKQYYFKQRKISFERDFFRILRIKNKDISNKKLFFFWKQKKKRLWTYSNNQFYYWHIFNDKYKKIKKKIIIKKKKNFWFIITKLHEFKNLIFFFLKVLKFKIFKKFDLKMIFNIWNILKYFIFKYFWLNYIFFKNISYIKYLKHFFIFFLTRYIKYFFFYWQKSIYAKQNYNIKSNSKNTIKYSNLFNFQNVWKSNKFIKFIKLYFLLLLYKKKICFKTTLKIIYKKLYFFFLFKYISFFFNKNFLWKKLNFYINFQNYFYTFFFKINVFQKNYLKFIKKKLIYGLKNKRYSKNNLKLKKSYKNLIKIIYKFYHFKKLLKPSYIFLYYKKYLQLFLEKILQKKFKSKIKINIKFLTTLNYYEVEKTDLKYSIFPQNYSLFWKTQKIYFSLLFFLKLLNKSYSYILKLKKNLFNYPYYRKIKHFLYQKWFYISIKKKIYFYFKTFLKNKDQLNKLHLFFKLKNKNLFFFNLKMFLFLKSLFTTKKTTSKLIFKLQKIYLFLKTKFKIKKIKYNKKFETSTLLKKQYKYIILNNLWDSLIFNLVLIIYFQYLTPFILSLKKCLEYNSYYKQFPILNSLQKLFIFIFTYFNKVFYGFKLIFKGRINKKLRKNNFLIKLGVIDLNNLNLNIKTEYNVANTKFGTIGIKLICAFKNNNFKFDLNYNSLLLKNYMQKIFYLKKFNISFFTYQKLIFFLINIKKMRFGQILNKLQKKKIKFKKKGSFTNKKNLLTKGNIGLLIKTKGYISSNEINTCKIILKKKLLEKTKVWLNKTNLLNITKKSINSRMGKGKGKVVDSKYIITPGHILFEVLTNNIKKGLLTIALIQKKLSISTKIVYYNK